MSTRKSEVATPAGRREFLKTTTTVTARLLASALSSPTVYGQSPHADKVLGANDRLGVGFIGVGGRGRTHLAVVQYLIKSGENLHLSAVCDAYRNRLYETAKLDRGQGLHEAS